MPTTFVKGDLFEDSKGPDLYGLAFAAECDGTIDRGVAAAFKKRWPALAESGKTIQPGDVLAVQGDKVIVYALGIFQGEKPPQLSSLVRACERLLERAVLDGISRIAFARVAGLDPARVKRVLTDAGEKTHLNLVVFEQFVRAKTTSG